MKSRRYTLQLLILFTTLLASASFARAQNPRTFVSGIGKDASPNCTEMDPCRTFANALTKTSAGGEINAMDVADYGHVLIDKSVTIDGKGTGAYITVDNSAAGIQVLAGGADRITIRNLSINGRRPGATPGHTGILFISGNVLSVENVVMQNLALRGIEFMPSIGEYLVVKDSFIRNCVEGIVITSTVTGISRAAIDRTRIEDCEVGILVGVNSRVAVRDSFFVANVNALWASGSMSDLTVTDTEATHNTRGVRSSGGASVRLTGNTVTFNTIGLASETGGQILSAGNNTVSGNNINGVPTGPIPPV